MEPAPLNNTEHELDKYGKRTNYTFTTVAMSGTQIKTSSVYEIDGEKQYFHGEWELNTKTNQWLPTDFHMQIGYNRTTPKNIKEIETEISAKVQKHVQRWGDANKDKILSAAKQKHATLISSCDGTIQELTEKIKEANERIAVCQKRKEQLQKDGASNITMPSTLLDERSDWND